MVIVKNKIIIGCAVLLILIILLFLLMPQETISIKELSPIKLKPIINS